MSVRSARPAIRVGQRDRRVGIDQCCIFFPRAAIRYSIMPLRHRISDRKEGHVVNFLKHKKIMQHFCRRQHPAPAAHPENSTYPLLRLYRVERTSGTYALIVHIRPGAGDLATFHSNILSLRVNSTASRIARYESLLQQRGPPTLPILSRALAVILLERPQASCARGVAPVMIDMYIPALIPAPQAPQNPQAPPGTCFPRLYISERLFARSISPPAFL